MPLPRAVKANDKNKTELQTNIATSVSLQRKRKKYPRGTRLMTQKQPQRKNEERHDVKELNQGKKIVIP